MHKKLIFLDIDGTLCVAGQNTPPASALAAIRKAQANGHLVVLCSGRNYGMLAPLLAHGFDGVVCCAGGYIEVGGTVVYDCPMTPAQQQQALAVMERSGVYRTIETKLHTYTDESFKAFLQKSTGSNSELVRWRRQLEADLGIQPMSAYAGEPIYKIVFMSPGLPALDEPIRQLQAEFTFCIQDPDATGIVNGELINKQFNKGTGVRRLAEYLHIPLADTIAFGDSMNDVEMLETAAVGVCMANGSKTLQDLADLVCPAVQDDGLARAFARLGLTGEGKEIGQEMKSIT